MLSTVVIKILCRPSKSQHLPQWYRCPFYKASDCLRTFNGCGHDTTNFQKKNKKKQTVSFSLVLNY